MAAFIIYEFYRVGSQGAASHALASIPTLVLGGLALLLRALVLLWAIRLYRGFGSGLAAALAPRSSAAKNERSTLLG